ncbi:MAG: hypothetical protein WD768_09420 [Phycisphaeraceae bacterium]
MDTDLLNRFPLLLTNHAYRRFEGVQVRDVIGTVATDDLRITELPGLIPQWARPLIGTSCLSTEESRHVPAKVGEIDLCFKPRVILTPDSRKDMPSLISLDCSTKVTEDFEQGLYLDTSVIFSAIQIAWLLGARRIVCVGIDMTYTGPTTHFVPNIRMPHAPEAFDYNTYCRPMVVAYRQFFEARGVEFLNATPGGRVEELRRVSLQDLLESTPVS